MSSDRLSTEQTAARLGVKRETVYAYVSRGVLSREKAVDGRASTFDVAEVERLRRKRLGDHPGRLEVPVATTVVEVRDGMVAYRGRPLTELIEARFTYERTADLLWQVGSSGRWLAEPAILGAVSRAVASLPFSATSVDRLLAGAVAGGSADPFRDDRGVSGVASSTRSLVAAMVESLPLVGPEPGPNSSIAERLWPRLTSIADSGAPILDRALVLLADHGMATSTLAARMAASTRAGGHAAVLAGLGALTGPLHGAASRSVHALFSEAERAGAEAAIARVLRDGGRVPGIGHFVHESADPRFDLLMAALVDAGLDESRLDIVSSVLSLTAERIPVAPNIDFALGSLSFAAHMPADAGELIFAVARIVGWVAHALEEYEEAPLRFRPLGRYVATRPRPAP